MCGWRIRSDIDFRKITGCHVVDGLDRGIQKERMFVKFSRDLKLGGVVGVIDERSKIHNDFTRFGD